jgi:anti-sigma factor RsiW
VTQTERDTQARVRERVPGESIHATIRARLSDYLDGSLPPAEVDDIRQHLDSCADCQAFWRTLLRVVTTTGQLPGHSLRQAAKERLGQAMRTFVLKS